MKKRTLITLLIALCFSTAYTQVAINKDGSQPNANSILHIKGDVDQKNILLEPGTDGNVGIGTDNPTATLDIQGSLKVNDGSQGNNKVLVSNSEGKASWKKITDVSSGLMSPSFPNGLDGIIPKTIAVNSSSSFQVPDKLTFYILNIYSDHTNHLRLDGYPITYGFYNYSDGTNPTAHLNQPLMIGAGSIISGSDAHDIVLNGYLAGNGTGGNDTPWNCGDLLVDDRDGRDYQTVQIGNQCWMAQNIDVGTMVNGNVDQTDNSVIEKYCYNDDASNCTIYGGLYQWNEMMQYVNTEGVQGLCPTAWHLPTDEEYKTLEMQLGMTLEEANDDWWRGVDEGAKLAGNESLWSDGLLDSNVNFGLSGFNAVPGGGRSTANGGIFYTFHVTAYFWTSTTSGTGAANRGLYNTSTRILRHTNTNRNTGYSVRCIKD